MKVIFLDFDGVLNGIRYINLMTRENKFGILLDPERLELLKQIVDETDAKIVLSTSWREHWNRNPQFCDEIGDEINQTFGEYGLEIYSKTPDITAQREYQIESWLKEHTEAESFIVLDDMAMDLPFLNHRFIRTSGFLGGLTEDDVEMAIKLLNE